MGEKVGKVKIKREKGFFYYVGKDGAVYRKKVGIKNKNIKPERVTEKIVKREKRYLYYIGKRGYIEKTKAGK